MSDPEGGIRAEQGQSSWGAGAEQPQPGPAVLARAVAAVPGPDRGWALCSSPAAPGDVWFRGLGLRGSLWDTEFHPAGDGRGWGAREAGCHEASSAGQMVGHPRVREGGQLCPSARG